ncbi:hypothetical protein AB1Y20_001382 [Prymnesium parvum]|uniref:ADP,ATP carrier protein n=1 Tax=Prymnesium parvum TaxID=97485 RepID=A0AB34K8H8_PRYPA
MAPSGEAVEFGAFLLLGMGSQWIVNDALFQNMDIFTSVLPEGLQLPNTAGSLSGAIGTVVVLVLWAVVCAGGLSEAKYTTGSWILISVSPIAAFVAAVAWRALIGRTSIVVWVSLFLSSSVGQASYFIQMPMLAQYFSETALSATLTGSGVGSMTAGGLGLVQAASAAFGPTPFMLIITAVCTLSTASWAFILSRGLGRPRTTGSASKILPPAQPSLCCFFHEEEGRKSRESSPLVLSAEPRLFVPQLLACLAMGSLINITTWGLTFLQFATSSASCSCDPSDRVAQETYDLATALSYVAMPLGGLLSYLVPLYDIRVLSALVVVHTLFYLLQTLAVANVGFMSCSAGARFCVILSNIFLRGIFQYATAMQYRVINRLFEDAPTTRSRASALYGTLTSWATVLMSFLAYGLVTSHAVSCTVSAHAFN